MVEIKDPSGKVISRSRNLRGIRAYTSKHIATNVSITKSTNGNFGSWDALLRIEFSNGITCESFWASWSVLRLSLSNWRNLYGAPLTINGASSGTVGKSNPWLV